MKILSAQQIREADAHTIAHEPVSSINLMERAAKASALRIEELTKAGSFFYIFCGKGNNGGDGLAIARLLAAANRKVEVLVVEHIDKASADHDANLKKLKGIADVLSISKPEEIPHLQKENAFIIDALLGTGVNKPVDGILAETIELIHKSGLPVISIDVPSGLFCDTKSEHKHVVKAQLTLSFQRPKLSFMFSENAPFVGRFEILDIGLDEQFIESQASEYHYLHVKDIAGLLIPRQKFAHKGSFGHALLLAGSKGKAGAAVLAAKACLRSGAGLLTTHLPHSLVNIMQTSLPEAMVSVDEAVDHISALPKNGNFSAIGVGPGIGTDKETAQALKLLIQNAAAPLVFDADALNILSENKTWLAFLPPMSILTPHPKEFDRLCGAHTSEFSRLQSCRDFAHKHRVIVVLKGAHTAVVMPDKKVFFNSTGNPALAKGGSGDVLTGMVLGLLAQVYSPASAALIAVFVHGRAADMYVRDKSERGMLAGDLVDLLPEAFLF